MKSNIPKIFIQDFPHWKKIEFFRTILYIFLLVNTLSLLPIAYQLWGYYGMIGTRGWDTTVFWPGSGGFINILSHPANSYLNWFYIVIVVGQLFFLITGLLRIFPKLSSIAIYVCTTNLFLKGFLAFTGGEVLINLTLFYMMFIHRSDKLNGPWYSRHKIAKAEPPEFTFLQNILNNTFYWAILIQVCLLYFFSTFYKLFDPYWQSGEALMYTSRVSAFSGGLMKSLFSDNYLFSAIATYLTLIYQGLFGILVWFKRIKIPLLLLGVFFHLMIGFGMGIFTFGMIMIIVYIPFLEDNHIEKIKRIFDRSSAKITENV